MELSSTEGNCDSLDSAKTSCFTFLNTSVMLRLGSSIAFSILEVKSPLMPVPSEATFPGCVANTTIEPCGASIRLKPDWLSRVKLGKERHASSNKMLSDLLDDLSTAVTEFIFTQKSSRSLGF